MMETVRTRQHIEKKATTFKERLARLAHNIPPKTPALSHHQEEKDLINLNTALRDKEPLQPRKENLFPREIENPRDEAWRPEPMADRILEGHMRFFRYRMQKLQNEIEKARQENGLQLNEAQANHLTLKAANALKDLKLKKTLYLQEQKLMKILADDGKTPGSLTSDELIKAKARAFQDVVKGVNVPHIGKVKLQPKQQKLRAENLHRKIRQNPHVKDTLRRQMNEWRQRHTMLTTKAIKELGRS